VDSPGHPKPAALLDNEREAKLAQAVDLEGPHVVLHVAGLAEVTTLGHNQVVLGDDKIALLDPCLVRYDVISSSGQPKKAQASICRAQKPIFDQGQGQRHGLLAFERAGAFFIFGSE
jgi:hypothetical protein